MKDLISKTAKYRAEARRRKLWQRVVSLLACVVVFITTYAQILPAITLEADLFEPDGHVHTDECYKIVKTEEKTELDCPLELHTHTAACYDADGALACSYADFVVHTHDSFCYDENGKLVCTLPEVETHTHTALCYPVVIEDEPAADTGSTVHVHTDECYTVTPGALLCEQEETDGHAHTEDCYVETEQLVCELEESEGHTHTDLCMDAEGLPELCGLEESDGHTHDESCYETVLELVCEQEEAEPHTHTEDCYAPAEKELTCGFEESEEEAEGSTGQADLLAQPDEDPRPICGQEEIELHTHTAACFGAGGAVVCGQLEVLEHQHTEDCFRVVQEASEEKVLDCAYTGSEEKKDEEDEEKPANSDSTDEEEEKPADSSAGEDKDGEKPADSDSTEEKPANSDSTGEKPADSGSTGGDKDGNEGTEKDADKDTDKDGKTPTDGTTVPSDPDDAPVLAPATLAERVLAAAESYIGYKEDTEDCDIDADGEMRGLTQFGLHYGMPYEKWDAMFVAYCLEEAGAEELPSAADCLFDIDVWASMLDGAGYCQTAELYTPAPGDVAFFDLDGDGTLDHVAFVEKVTDTRLFVIAGDSNDCVRRASYARADESIVGYGVLPRDEDEPQDSPTDEPDEGAADDDLTGEPGEDETEDDPAASDPVDEPQDGEDGKTDEKDPDKPDEDGKTEEGDPDKAGEGDKTGGKDDDKKDDDAAQDPDDELPAEPQTAAEKLLAEAVRHIGYTESAEDCQEDADGESRGATLFGEYYGRPYEKWDALFVAYCLEKAGVEGLPAAADCNFDIDSWMTLLAEAERFEPAGLYTPAPGDLVFFDLDADGLADHVAVVEKAAENRVSVIAGDTAGAAADVADSVRRTSYSMLDERLRGYATLAERDAPEEAGTYTYEDETICAEVTLPEGSTLPEGAVLSVEPITEESMDYNYEQLVWQAEESVAHDAAQIALYDISFYTAGGEYLPVADTASVTLRLKQDAPAENAAELVVLHYQEEDALPVVLETVEPTAEPDDTDDAEDADEGIAALAFETEGFSLFALLALDDGETGGGPDTGTTDTTTGTTNTSNAFRLSYEYITSDTTDASISTTYIITFRAVYMDADGEMSPLPLEKAPIVGDESKTYIFNAARSSESIFVPPPINGYTYKYTWYNGKEVDNIKVGQTTQANQGIKTAFVVNTIDNNHYSRVANLTMSVVYEKDDVTLDGKTFAIVNTAGGNQIALTTSSGTANSVSSLKPQQVEVLSVSGGQYQVDSSVTGWTFELQPDGSSYLIYNQTTEDDGTITKRYLQLFKTKSGNGGSLEVTEDENSATPIIVQWFGDRVALVAKNANANVNYDNAAGSFWCYSSTDNDFSKHYLCTIKQQVATDYAGTWAITKVDGNNIYAMSSTGGFTTQSVSTVNAEGAYILDDAEQLAWSFELPENKKKEDGVYYLSVTRNETKRYLHIDASGLSLSEEPQLVYVTEGTGIYAGMIRLSNADNVAVQYGNNAFGVSSNGEEWLTLYRTSKTYGVVTETGNHPSSIINLFDYWIDERTSQDNSRGANDHLNGVNKGHALKFFQRANQNDDGKWNTWAGNWIKSDPTQVDKYEICTGIVANTLNEDKYPYLSGGNVFATRGTNLSDLPESAYTESLAYLFEPKDDPDYKKSFTNVTGLLQVDSQGYYYYDSTQNFAEFDEDKNTFTLYDTWGVRTGGTSPNGQFFPFNKMSEVVTKTSVEKEINHYFGLTLTTRFQQQYGGHTNSTRNTETIFEFKGDDDVWIFIDDVLVADLGGIHDAASVSIDFSTGIITINNVYAGTLKSAFQNAGALNKASWNGETFADDSYHILKFFYLERGNTDSNLKLTYNLTEIPTTGIYKVSQYGTAVAGATFKVYKVNKENDVYTITDEEAVYTGTTNANGEMVFVDKSNNMPLSLAELEGMFGNYFVIKETPPDKYSTISEEIWMRIENGLMVCDNTYDSGVYAAPTLQVAAPSILQLVNGREVDYYDLSGTSTNTPKGTLFAVMLKRVDDGELTKEASWQPVYGSSEKGYQVMSTSEGFIAAAIEAAKEQRKYGEIEFSLASSGAMQLNLENLPGDAMTYYHVLLEQKKKDDSVDLDDTQYTIAYYWTEASSLDSAEVGNTYRVNSEATGYYQFDRAFGATIEVPNIINRLFAQKFNEEGELLNDAVFALYEVKEETDDKIYYVGHSNDTPGTEVLIYLQANANAFNQGTATVGGATGYTYQVITSPEAERGKIEVKDASGTPQYTITPYQTATTLAASESANPSGEDGTATFSGIDAGTYYLREVVAPPGYLLNDTEVMVLVDEGTSAIYANAGDANDGVRVARGPGYLMANMRKFAAIENVDNTLSWIYARMRIKESSSFDAFDGVPTNWTDWSYLGGEKTPDTIYLKYDDTGNMALFNYIENDEKSSSRANVLSDGRRLYTDVGWSYYELYQDYEYESTAKTSGANYENLQGKEIAHLFSRSTYIQVTDQKSFELPETGGRGWRTQTVCGAALLALPLLYGIYLYHRRRKGGDVILPLLTVQRTPNQTNKKSNKGKESPL